MHDRELQIHHQLILPSAISQSHVGPNYNPFHLPPLLPPLQILEDLDEQIYCIHLQEEALQRRLNGMSVGDVLAHYRGGEGLTALLGVMERTTLESISIEKSSQPSRHTHTCTYRQTFTKSHTHLTLAFLYRCLALITFCERAKQPP